MFFSIVSHNGKKPLPLYPTMEKTSSVISHNEGKLLPLYPTMKKNHFHCIPQQRKISSIVGYNGRKPAALWDTMLKIFLGYSTLHKILLMCRTQRKKNFLHCGIQWNKICLPSWDCSPLYPTTEKILFCCIPQCRKTFSVVYHSGKKLFRFIPQRKKTSFVVSHKGKKT